MSIGVIRFEMSTPGDCTSLSSVLERIDARKASRLAIIAKTEGTATVNDFGRSLATLAIQTALARANVTAPCQVILSMGCEGIITPGGYLFVDMPERDDGTAGLALGMACSDPMEPSDLVNDRHIAITRATVDRAIADAGISAKDVALVFAKSPLLTHAMAIGLPAEQRERANRSSAARAAAALGIGVALGEIASDAATSAAIGTRADLYTRRAMVFSGTETPRTEIIVLGNRPGGHPSVRSGLFADLLDVDSMAAVIAGTSNEPFQAVRRMKSDGHVAAVFLKAGLATDGRLRGNRTTVFSSEVDPDKQMRAAASGVLGALLGDTRMFVSGGAEHQAPMGGGVLAVISGSGTPWGGHN
jgi:cyanuric acid amidohydrolase